MRTTQIFVFIAVVILAASCGEAGNSESSAINKADRMLASADSLAFSADPSAVPLDDPSRKIVRTVELDCRVNDVFKATTQLESIVKTHGGIVEESKTQNEVFSLKELPYGADSVRKVRTYVTTADITIRIPAGALDTLVEFIPQIATFIDHRNITQKDLTLVYLGTAMRNEALKPAQGTEIAFSKAHKTSDVIKADEYNTNGKNQEIERKLSNLGLLDQVNYATVHLTLTQPEMIDEQILLNADAAVRLSYGQKLSGVVSGIWDGLMECSLILLRLLPVLLFGMIVWLLFRKSLKKRLLFTDTK